MAKKKITSDGYDDLDKLMDELDDFDFDMEQEDSKIDMSNPREAAKKIAKSAGENFLKDIKNIDSAKLSHFAKKALPKEFQINEFGDLASSVKNEITSGISGIKQEASKTLKYFNKYIPETTKLGAAIKRLNEKLDVQAAEAVARRNEAAEREEQVKADIAAALGDINERQEAAAALQHTIETKRFESTNQILVNLLSNSEIQKSFNTQITDRYFRKSLELQYHQLFATRSQTKLLEESYKQFNTYFKQIMENTALPDLVKLRNSEQFKDAFKAKMREDFANYLYNGDHLFNRFKNNITTGIKSFMTDIKDGFVQANDGFEMASMGDGMITPGQAIGTWLSQSVVGKAGTKFGSFLEKRFGSSNAYREAAKIAKEFKVSPSEAISMIREHIKNNENDGRLKKYSKAALTNILDLASAYAPSGIASKRTLELGGDNLHDATLFDGITKTSINKIIPGYLAKIHSEVRAFRLGDRDTKDLTKSELKFNIDTNELVTGTQLQTHINTKTRKKIFRSLPWAVDTLINMFEKHAGGIIGNLDTSEGSKFRAQFKQALVAFKLKNRSGGTQSFLSGTNFSQHFRDENLRKKMTKACKLLRLKRNKITTKAGFEDEIGNTIIEALSGINVPLLERDLKAYSDLGYSRFLSNDMNLTTYDKDYSNTFRFDSSKYDDYIINLMDYKGPEKELRNKDDGDKPVDPLTAAIKEGVTSVGNSIKNSRAGRAVGGALKIVNNKINNLKSKSRAEIKSDIEDALDTVKTEIDNRLLPVLIETKGKISNTAIGKQVTKYTNELTSLIEKNPSFKHFKAQCPYYRKILEDYAEQATKKYEAIVQTEEFKEARALVLKGAEEGKVLTTAIVAYANGDDTKTLPTKVKKVYDGLVTKVDNIKENFTLSNVKNKATEVMNNIKNSGWAKALAAHANNAKAAIKSLISSKVDEIDTNIKTIIAKDPGLLRNKTEMIKFYKTVLLNKLDELKETLPKDQKQAIAYIKEVENKAEEKAKEACTSLVLYTKTSEGSKLAAITQGLTSTRNDITGAMNKFLDGYTTDSLHLNKIKGRLSQGFDVLGDVVSNGVNWTREFGNGIIKKIKNVLEDVKKDFVDRVHEVCSDLDVSPQELPKQIENIKHNVLLLPNKIVDNIPSSAKETKETAKKMVKNLEVKLDDLAKEAKETYEETKKAYDAGGMDEAEKVNKKSGSESGKKTFNFAQVAKDKLDNMVNNISTSSATDGLTFFGKALYNFGRLTAYTRQLDRKIFFGFWKGFGKGIWTGIKTFFKSPWYAIKGLFGLKKIAGKVMDGFALIQKGMEDTRKERGWKPGLIQRLLANPFSKLKETAAKFRDWNAAAIISAIEIMSGANVASSQNQEAAIDNLSNVVLKTSEIKSSADLQAAINEKNRAFNDKDGNGVRDGSEKRIWSKIKNFFGGVNKDKEKEEESSWLSSLLKFGIPLALAALGGGTGGLGSALLYGAGGLLGLKALKGAKNLFTNMKNLKPGRVPKGKLGLLLAGLGLYGAFGGSDAEADEVNSSDKNNRSKKPELDTPTAALGAANLGMDVLYGAPALKFLATGGGGKALEEMKKKIPAALKQIEDRLAKRVGPKVAAKIVGTKLVKYGVSAAVGATGVGMLAGVGLAAAFAAWDAAWVGYYMSTGLSFASALSKQFLGFDVFDDKDPVVDDNGNPVKVHSDKKIAALAAQGIDTSKMVSQTDVDLVVKYNLMDGEITPDQIKKAREIYNTLKQELGSRGLSIEHIDGDEIDRLVEKHNTDYRVLKFGQPPHECRIGAIKAEGRELQAKINKHKDKAKQERDSRVRHDYETKKILADHKANFNLDMSTRLAELAKERNIEKQRMIENGVSKKELEIFDEETKILQERIKNNTHIKTASNKVAKGNWGDYGYTPMPASLNTYANNISMSKEDVINVLTQAYKVTGLESDGRITLQEFIGIAARESGLNPTIKNKNSSATGLFQFITRTWDAMLKKYGPAYGLKPDVKPTNAIANAILGACYIKDIIKTLEKNKIPVNAGSIYAGLHIGEGGVVKLYNGDTSYIPTHDGSRATNFGTLVEEKQNAIANAYEQHTGGSKLEETLKNKDLNKDINPGNIRIGGKTYHPGDPGYEEARARIEAYKKDRYETMTKSPSGETGGAIAENKNSSNSGSKSIQTFVDSAKERANSGETYSQAYRTGSNSSDCSSFVGKALNEAGFNIDINGFTTATMPKILTGLGFEQKPYTYNVDELRPGDILYFRRNGKGHTEIYTGNGELTGAHSTKSGVSTRKWGLNKGQYDFTHYFRWPSNDIPMSAPIASNEHTKAKRVWGGDENPNIGRNGEVDVGPFRGVVSNPKNTNPTVSDTGTFSNFTGEQNNKLRGKVNEIYKEAYGNDVSTTTANTTAKSPTAKVEDWNNSKLTTGIDALQGTLKQSLEAQIRIANATEKLLTVQEDFVKEFKKQIESQAAKQASSNSGPMGIPNYARSDFYTTA